MIKDYQNWHRIYKFLGIKIQKKITPQKKERVNLIFDPKTGIGNRIFALMNAINYFNPIEINFYWEDRTWVSAKFFDLFNPCFDIKINEYNDSKCYNSFKNSKNEITIYYPSCAYKKLNGQSLALLYNSIPIEVLKEYKKPFELLKPAEKVLERIGSANLDSDFCALQIRNAPDWGEYGRNEKIELFYREIDKLDNNKQIFLCAMNKEISNTIKQKYPNRIVELENKNYKSMIDALSDLYILKNAKSAIYSNGSTFCELAFWLSQYNQQVTIVGSNENWK